MGVFDFRQKAAHFLQGLRRQIHRAEASAWTWSQVNEALGQKVVEAPLGRRCRDIGYGNEVTDLERIR